jgi:hypothetical protein
MRVRLICSALFQEFGHNAEPVKRGRCCNLCNDASPSSFSPVSPARRANAHWQDIVELGISESYLRWRGIEATLQLSQSTNSKVVVIGSGKDGLPIILGNVDTPASPPVGSTPRMQFKTVRHRTIEEIADGRSARGMIIIDQKDTYLTQVDKLTHYRRFDVPRGRQLKRVVEFSHSIDSLRHPLIQLSDLVIYTTRKFLECDNDYRPNWTAEARNFFASCYDRVQKRMWRTNLIDVEGRRSRKPHVLLKLCQSTHNGQWKRNYTIT